MGIVIAIVVIVGILGCIYEIKKKPNDNLHQRIKEEYLKKQLHYIEPFIVNYIGGIKNISLNNNVSFNVTEEGLLLLYSDSPHPFIGYANEKLIKWCNIKDMSFQTETSIKEQVSLGKLFVFGILAFGMNGKRKNINNEYLVLTIDENNSIYNMILQAENQNDNQRVYNDLNEYINEFKEAN